MAPLVVFVVGARPNFMKTAPVMHALETIDPGLELVLVHTGQHYDPEMSSVLLAELGLRRPDVNLGVGPGSHAGQTARALEGVARVLEERSPALVVVSGDVNSTLAGALAAAKLGIAVAHIEAGLRSFDPRMPEEQNRKLTDHLSSILLAHSSSAVENLAREGIDRRLVHLVGNTMIDSLLAIVGQAREERPWDAYGLDAEGYGLVTLHRPALVDEPELLAETMDALTELSKEVPLVFPVHPRTRSRMTAQGLGRGTDRLKLTEPLGYVGFVGLEAAARFVLTDSGGIQEETSALGVPCFTLRVATERPVTVELGTNTLLGLEPASILEIPARLGAARPAREIPLWDGRAGERAATALASFVRGGGAAA